LIFIAVLRLSEAAGPAGVNAATAPAAATGTALELCLDLHGQQRFPLGNPDAPSPAFTLVLIFMVVSFNGSPVIIARATTGSSYLQCPLSRRS
jgi:hypothetical protein